MEHKAIAEALFLTVVCCFAMSCCTDIVSNIQEADSKATEREYYQQHRDCKAEEAATKALKEMGNEVPNAN